LRDQHRWTLNVLDACRKHDIRKMVFASSSSVYGNPERLPLRESDRLSPISPYALSKFCGETYARLYWELYGIETVALRYFNVYGLRQNADSPYSGVISIFMKNIAQGRPLKIYGDGRQTRDFVNVADVVSANILAAGSKDAPGKAFNIGTGNAVSLNELIHTIEKVTGRKSGVVNESPRKGDIMHSCPDITPAKKMLGFRPSVSLEAGLRGMLVPESGSAKKKP
jgi:UDP-glucose 4-epimerase